MDKKYEILLKSKTMTDIALIAYMTYLNEKGLLQEAKKYVQGFISSLKGSDIETLVRKNDELLEQSGVKHDAGGSAK